MTVDEDLSLVRLLRRDQRYPLEAYLFVRDALTFASDILEMGSESITETAAGGGGGGGQTRVEHHLTGQELCEALRIFALNQFGLMSPLVLKNWGIASTADFGEIVYNMIDAGLMKKSKGDHPSHFENVYDFATAFEDDFKCCRMNLKA
jgi:uncharacterized repeat protein (TIGR04138 family)